VPEPVLEEDVCRFEVELSLKRAKKLFIQSQTMLELNVDGRSEGTAAEDADNDLTI
jgi:hypothetical protein